MFNRVILLFSLVSLVMDFSPALAVGKCDSILNLGKDCYSEKPLIIAHGIEVKLVSSGKQKIYYPVTEESRKNFEGVDFDTYCPDKKCLCEEDVSYAEFATQTRGIKIINTKEKKQAENYKCSVENGYIRRLPKFIYTSSVLISVAVHKLGRVHGAGGSCHGEYQFTTYNAETGNEYKLKDIIAESKLSELKDVLVSEFIDIYAKQNDVETKRDLESIKKSVQEYIGVNLPTTLGFVVENGKVYTNIDSFILSCADGSFFPVEVPEKFVNPEFLQKLKK